MQLIPEAKRVARKAWSVRLLALQVFLFGAAEGLFTIWPALADYLPVSVLIWGGIVLGVLTLASRFIMQPEVRADD